MARRKRWRAPNNPTIAAKQVWRKIYDEPWPKGWRVEWAGFMRGALGLTIYREKRVLLSYADARNRPARVVKNGRTIHWRNIFTGDLDQPEIEVRSEGPMIRPARQGEVLRTLVHEFVHVRNGHKFRHGKEFERLVDWAWNRLVA